MLAEPTTNWVVSGSPTRGPSTPFMPVSAFIATTCRSEPTISTVNNIGGRGRPPTSCRWLPTWRSSNTVAPHPTISESSPSPMSASFVCWAAPAVRFVRWNHSWRRGDRLPHSATSNECASDCHGFVIGPYLFVCLGNGVRAPAW